MASPAVPSPPSSILQALKHFSVGIKSIPTTYSPRSPVWLQECAVSMGTRKSPIRLGRRKFAVGLQKPTVSLASGLASCTHGTPDCIFRLHKMKVSTQVAWFGLAIACLFGSALSVLDEDEINAMKAIRDHYPVVASYWSDSTLTNGCRYWYSSVSYATCTDGHLSAMYVPISPISPLAPYHLDYAMLPYPLNCTTS